MSEQEKWPEYLQFPDTSDEEIWTRDGGGLPRRRNPEEIIYSVNDADARHPETRVKELEGGEHTKDSFPVVIENFRDYSFPQAHLEVTSLDPDFDRGGMGGPWRDVATGILEATQGLQAELATLESREDRWAGETHNAAMANLHSSLREPETAGLGANAMSAVVDTFASTLRTTRDNFVSMSDKYNKDKANYPEQLDVVERHYADFAQRVLGEVYAPNILAVAQSNPGFTIGADSKVDPSAALGPTPDGPGGGGGGIGGGASGFGGGAGSFGRGAGGGGGIGGPAFRGTSVGPSDFRGLTDLARRPTVPETPDFPKAPITGPTPPTGPAGIGNAAKDAASQAANAAKQAAGAAGNPLKPPGGMPPEGLLGLGPKGVDGPLSKTGGAAGAGGSGAGPKGGAGVPRSMSPLASANGPLTAARGMAMPGAAVSAAGLGSGAGMPPPMPPPGGGQRGGGDEKDHKVLKALRRKQYGEAVVGENEAIVPVVGESDEPQPAKSEQT